MVVEVASFWQVIEKRITLLCRSGFPELLEAFGERLSLKVYEDQQI
jgi:hypothetical protein